MPRWGIGSRYGAWRLGSLCNLSMMGWRSRLVPLSWREGPKAKGKDLFFGLDHEDGGLGDVLCEGGRYLIVVLGHLVPGEE